MARYPQMGLISHEGVWVKTGLEISGVEVRHVDVGVVDEVLHVSKVEDFGGSA